MIKMVFQPAGLFFMPHLHPWTKEVAQGQFKVSRVALIENQFGPGDDRHPLRQRIARVLIGMRVRQA